MKTISKIDKHFKLLPHTVSFHRHKKISELCKTPTLKNALESTNISTKNTFVKKNKNIEQCTFALMFGQEKLFRDFWTKMLT